MIAVAPSITALAETSERTRQVDAGIRGCAARRSKAPNPGRRPMETASGTSVRAEAQPATAMPCMARTSSTRPAISVTAPGMSSSRGSRMRADELGTMRSARLAATRPMGTF
jgi:hypothetical protein